MSDATLIANELLVVANELAVMRGCATFRGCQLIGADEPHLLLINRQ